jgi:predicted dehydrogenase
MEVGQLGNNLQSIEMNFSQSILIIGFGSIGKRHTNNLLSLTKSNLIIYTNRKNIKKTELVNHSKNKNRIKILNDFKKCLNEKPKICFICNETNLHIDYAMKLAKENMDIFVEKPLSHSMKNISSLQSMMQKNKKILMVGCNFRFYPPIQKIKQLISKKFIGNIISVQSENNSFLPDWHPSEDYSKNYAAKDSKGGGVTLTQIHELDFLTWIFGNQKKIHSLVGKFSNLKITSDDLSVSIIELKNKIIIELHLDYFSRPFYKRIKIRGTNGIIYWNSKQNSIKTFDNNKQKWSIITVSNNYSLNKKYVNRMYIDELKYFLDHVSSRKQPMNNLNEAIPILKTALKIKSSHN